MERLLTKFGLAIGLEPNFQTAIVYGTNPYPWPTAAAALDVVSDSTDDAAAGIGAWTVKIEGLDTNFQEIEEEITLNGTTPVTTVQSFLRVNFVYTTSANPMGDGFNLGQITVSQTGGTDALATIQPSYGRATDAVFTVPAGHIAYLTGLVFGVLKTDASPVTAVMNIRVRDNEDATNSVYRTYLLTPGSTTIELKEPLAIEEKYDVFVVLAFASSNPLDAAMVRMDMKLVETLI